MSEQTSDRSAWVVAIVGAAAGILGALAGAFSSYLVQKSEQTHADRVAVTKVRQDTYVAFLDAVDTLELDSTKFAQVGANPPIASS